jgi:hypothetical protein
MPRTYVRGTGQRVTQDEQHRMFFYQPQFYDPYFFVQGSVPEKMVMAELVRRGIYFQHTPQENPVEWGNLKEIAKSDPTKWEADFLFPQWKIWLEVQGAYFHTMPGVVEKEALRFALIEAAGWRPIYWWDYDIETRLVELMDSVPEFYFPPSDTKKGLDKAKAGDTDRGFAWRDRSTPWGKGPGNRPGKKGHAWWHSREDRYKESMHAGSHHNRPRMFGRVTPGLPFLEGGVGIDHLAGLRRANSNRATTPQMDSSYRRTSTRKGKIRKRYSHR